MSSNSILIAGLGFVGEALAQALAAKGHHVIGLTHSESSFQRLQQNQATMDVRQADISQPDSLSRAITEKESVAISWVIHCASSGRGGPEQYRSVYRDGLANLHALCPRARLLFTSSTSVYAQTDGSWIDESSPAEPLRETSRILRETEILALESGGLVARLAGIYGPERSYILLKFLAGTAVIEGDGGRYINQAHRDDVVRALEHLIAQQARGIFNVVDSTPQTQRQLYAWLAKYFEMPLPLQAPPDHGRKRGWTHKRVSNRQLKATGWRPRYPSFQEAILHDPKLVPSIEDLVAP